MVHMVSPRPESVPPGGARRAAGSWVMECAAGARESFDRITILLARALDLPLASFSLLHEDRQVLASAFGLADPPEPHAEGAFARACLALDDLLAVPDTWADARFRDLPQVASPPYIRFYAGAPVYAPDGTVVGILSVVSTEPRECTPRMVGLLHDMRAVVEEMLLLVTMSAQDRLTRLLNRGYFEDMFGREWRRAQRDGSEIALVMVDIDFFKAYNDRFGHPAGDACLKQVAACLSEHFRRPGDVVSRYGGEEFAVVLPHTSAGDAARLARAAAAGVSALDILHPDCPLGHVTISAGVASAAPDLDGDRHTLLKAADTALYAAKAAGRNKVSSA